MASAAAGSSSGPQLGHGAGLQPRDHAAGQPARQDHADPLGHCRLQKPLRDRCPKACGWPRRRPTPRRWSCWRSTGSSSQSSRRTSASAFDRSRQRRPPDEPVWTTPLEQFGRHHAALPRCASIPASSIAVFFYDGPTSRAIAFEGLLNSGENFAARLKAGFKDSAQPQLESVATDGESYGHHHRHGEMALAYAVRLLEQDKTVKLTNYASFPRTVSARVGVRDRRRHLVELRTWRGALALQLRMQRRQAGMESEMASPAAPGTRRAARCDFAPDRAGGRKALQRCLGRARRIHRRDSRSQRRSRSSRFLAGSPEPSTHRLRSAFARLQLMEMQRHAQLMYTSCGWFFDDISGIETVQIIAYAARALAVGKGVVRRAGRGAGAGISRAARRSQIECGQQPAMVRASTTRRSGRCNSASSR